jgi:hypothetical protein
MELIWHWPQIVWVGFAAAGFGIAAVKHGEPRKPYSVWDQVFGIAIAVPLLYFGGFWAGVTP